MKCWSCEQKGAKRRFRITDARDLYFRTHFVCESCFNQIACCDVDYLRILVDVE
jgi:hypothetical protein